MTLYIHITGINDYATFMERFGSLGKLYLHAKSRNVNTENNDEKTPLYFTKNIGRLLFIYLEPR